MTPKSSIPVIYIISNGRSGSTLLELLLHAHSQMWTLGEVHRLSIEITRNDLCGCGSPLPECNFWNQVESDYLLKHNAYGIDYFRRHHGQGRVLRPLLLKHIFQNHIPISWKRKIDAYNHVNYRLFADALAQAQQLKPDVKWLIDASKDPYRLFWLSQSDKFDLYVLHVTKDPRGFTYSNIKNRVKHENYWLLRMSGRWLIENSIIDAICTRYISSEKYTHIRYEDLATRYHATLSAIANLTDTPYDPGVVNRFHGVINHGVSGNAMRHRKNEGIRFDDKWRYNLSKLQQKTIWTLCSYLGAKYGYTENSS